MVATSICRSRKNSRRESHVGVERPPAFQLKNRSLPARACSPGLGRLEGQEHACLTLLGMQAGTASDRRSAQCMSFSYGTCQGTSPSSFLDICSHPAARAGAPCNDRMPEFSSQQAGSPTLRLARKVTLTTVLPKATAIKQDCQVQDVTIPIQSNTLGLGTEADSQPLKFPWFATTNENQQNYEELEPEWL